MSTLQDMHTLAKVSDYPDYGGRWYNRSPYSGADAYIVSIAMSDDSLFQVVCLYSGRVYTTRDGGKTWTERVPTGVQQDYYWHCAACSSTGQYVIVGTCLDAGTHGRLYLSKDYGATWTEKRPIDDDDYSWYSLAMSANGQVIYAAIRGAAVYRTTDGGDTEPWTLVRNAANWYFVACGADGSDVLAGINSGRLWYSNNTGSNWTEAQPAGASDKAWRCGSVSRDGAYMLAGYTTTGRLYVSSDSGANWSQATAHADVDRNWLGCHCGEDGTVMMVNNNSNESYITRDSGTSWTRVYPVIGDACYHCIVDETGTKFLTSSGWDGESGALYYSEPATDSTPLPIVYGDLTDGSKGIWEAPCIAHSAMVYAFASHEVLSVANGNSIAVYADGDFVDSQYYTFDEKNDWLGQGDIATITFNVTTYAGKTITVQGKGKPTVTTGSTLLENIADIVYDFLTVEGGFAASTIDATSRAYAAQLFNGQSYKAAGVIQDDASYWVIISEMMGSFLGSAYKNGAGKLALEIDNGTVNSTGAPIIPRGDVRITDIKQRLVNVINQCPARYAYNYASGEFDSESDGSDTLDAGSQLGFGVRKPSNPYQCYWCRDLTSVNTMQSILVGKFARPVYEIEFENVGMKSLGIDVGDIFAMTVDMLYDEKESPLYNQFWKATSVSPDFRRGSIRFRALYTPYYMTRGGARDTTIY